MVRCEDIGFTYCSRHSTGSEHKFHRLVLGLRDEDSGLWDVGESVDGLLAAGGFRDKVDDGVCGQL